MSGKGSEEPKEAGIFQAELDFQRDREPCVLFLTFGILPMFVDRSTKATQANKNGVSPSLPYITK